jgi:putative tricarboxylic transport membrane protein
MANAIIVAATLILAGLYFYATRTYVRVLDFGDPFGPRAFPILLCGGLLLSAALLAYEMWRDRKIPAVENSEADPDNQISRVFIALSAITGIYFLMFQGLGYVASTAVYLMILTSYFNRGKDTANISTSLAVPLVTYLLFTRVLDVSLPSGLLPF